jgi:hypothetical protein
MTSNLNGDKTSRKKLKKKVVGYIQIIWELLRAGMTDDQLPRNYDLNQ